MIVLLVVLVACFTAWQWWQQHGKQALKDQWLGGAGGSGGQSSMAAGETGDGQGVGLNPEEELAANDTAGESKNPSGAASDSGIGDQGASGDGNTGGVVDDNDRTNRFLKQRVAELEQRLAESRQPSGVGKPSLGGSGGGISALLNAEAGGAPMPLTPSPFIAPASRGSAAAGGQAAASMADLGTKQEVAQVKQRLDKIDQALAQHWAWQRRQAAYLQLTQIRQQVAAGQPFRAQSSNLALLVADLAGAGESLQSLQSLSLQGVPSVSQLRQYYADAARQVWSEQGDEAAQADPAAQSGWWGWMKQQLRQLVTVRPDAGRAEPGSVAAYLTEVETALTAGDLAAVHAALQHLPDRNLKTLDKLTAGLNARLKADQALQDLEQRVVAALAQASAN